jgi:hypothetical protein
VRFNGKLGRSVGVSDKVYAGFILGYAEKLLQLLTKTSCIAAPSAKGLFTVYSQLFSTYLLFVIYDYGFHFCHYLELGAITIFLIKRLHSQVIPEVECSSALLSLDPLI